MTKAELIKELRNRTQAGFMDCKKALDANLDDLEAAIKWLRENGMAKAASKNASKVAAEGSTWAMQDADGAALIELNSQTDFTGKSEPFLALAKAVATKALEAKTNDIEQLKQAILDSGKTVEQACLELSSQTGEKIELRKLFYHPKKANETLLTYRHDNGKISSLIVLNAIVDQEKAKGLVLHLTAMNPTFISKKEVDPNWLENERNIIAKQLEQQNKPKEFADKIIAGRIQKLLAEVCFVSQDYVLDQNKTVHEVLKDLKAEIVLAKRFELGEGIEVQEVDFAAEVQAQMRK